MHTHTHSLTHVRQPHSITSLRAANAVVAALSKRVCRCDKILTMAVRFAIETVPNVAIFRDLYRKLLHMNLKMPIFGNIAVFFPTPCKHRGTI